MGKENISASETASRASCSQDGALYYAPEARDRWGCAFRLENQPLVQRSNGEETSSHRLSSSAGKEFGLIHKIISLINTQTLPRSTRELCLGKPQLAGYLSFQWGARQAVGRFTNPFFCFIRCFTRLQQLAGISASFPFGSGCTLRPRLAIKSRELMIAPGSEEPPPRSALVFQSRRGFLEPAQLVATRVPAREARIAPCCHETADCSPILCREGIRNPPPSALLRCNHNSPSPWMVREVKEGWHGEKNGNGTAVLGHLLPRRDGKPSRDGLRLPTSHRTPKSGVGGCHTADI